MTAGPFSADTLWAANASDLIIEPHDDVYLVFHKLSGDTHILNFLSAGIIDVLTRGGASNFNTIAERIWASLDLNATECPISLVQSTVLQLDVVGLVYPQRGTVK